MKKTLIVLMGESASGKDTILNQLVSYRPDLFHKVIPYTTRPKRENEKDGVDYYFIHDIGDINSEDIMTYRSFRDWKYIHTLSSLVDDKINIAIYDPRTIEEIIGAYSDELDIIVFRLRVPGKERLLRSLNREINPDVDEIVRRYIADSQDFDKDNIKEIPYIVVDNPSLDKILKILYNKKQDIIPKSSGGI